MKTNQTKGTIMRKNEMEIALELVERTFALLYADPQKGELLERRVDVMAGDNDAIEITFAGGPPAPVRALGLRRTFFGCALAISTFDRDTRDTQELRLPKAAFAVLRRRMLIAARIATQYVRDMNVWCLGDVLQALDKTETKLI